MIVDIHLHACGPPYDDEPLFWHLHDGRRLPTGCTRKESSPEMLLLDMDECGVDVAVVNAIEGWASNEDVSDMVKAHPGRLVGFAWVGDPRDGKSSAEELEHAVESLGLRGLKLHPPFQGFSPADPEVVPLLRRAADLGVPTFIHAAPWPGGNFATCLPEHIDALKHRVPEAEIIVGHMGAPRFLDLTMLAYQPGVYVETSGGLNMVADLFGLEFAARFIRSLGVENVLFGSDWTRSGNVEAFMDQNLDLVERMDLTHEERDLIKGGNARKLLGL